MKVGWEAYQKTGFIYIVKAWICMGWQTTRR